MTEEPKRVELETPDLPAETRAAFDELFPGVLADGVLDATRLGELLDTPVTAPADGRERFGLMWAGKRDAVRSLIAPSRGALVPDPENSIDFDTAQNVFIEGDNLEVLKLLQKAYNDRVKLIYIDPPYNTGNDFIYDDDFSDGLRWYLEYSGQLDEDGNRTSASFDTAGRRHSRWLSMMYPRLALARNLLTQDGLLAVSIDDNEAAAIRLVLDEIFGSENFIAQVVVQANKGGRDYLPLAQTHEYLLIYARNYAVAGVYDLPKEDSALPFADPRGRYETRELRNRNPRFHRGNRPNLYYPFYVDPAVTDEHGYAAVSLTQDEQHTLEVLPRNSEGADSCWRWGLPKAGGSIVIGDPVASQIVAKQVRTGKWNIYEKSRRSSQKAKTIWDETEVRTEAGTREVRRLFGAAVFDHPKPVDLVQKLIRISTQPEGDLVLDYFAGSGTLAHAVTLQNSEDGGTRRCLSVNLPEPTPADSAAASAGLGTVSAIAVERIRRVLNEVENGKGFGLRLYRLAASSFRDAGDQAVAADVLSLIESTLSEDADGEDVAAEVLLREGVPLHALWSRTEVGGYPAIEANGVAVVLSLEITDEVVSEALELGTRVVVFLEDGFAGADAVKANAVTNARNLGITLKTV